MFANTKEILSYLMSYHKMKLAVIPDILFTSFYPSVISKVEVCSILFLEKNIKFNFIAQYYSKLTCVTYASFVGGRGGGTCKF